MGLAHAKLSFVLSAFYQADRMIPGHEIVAVVSGTGPGVATLTEGDRVVVDPVIACELRGFEPCARCAAEQPHLCERFDQPGIVECLAPVIGYSDAVGGGWGQELVAHESHCYVVGDLPSRRAVLAEPASIALHAALRWERAGDRVVVIGPGSIGLLTAPPWMRHQTCIIMVGRRSSAASARRWLGAWDPAGRTRRRASPGRHRRGTCSAPHDPHPDPGTGVDAVFDCVGHSSTIDLGLHLLRPRGRWCWWERPEAKDADWRSTGLAPRVVDPRRCLLRP
ncbi:MAG: alcohol dehydrogenase catalytic domain-containing protein [Candidatus Nanopelagicales bacterium]